MNEYTLDTIRVGDSAQFTAEVDADWFLRFPELSGDYNPLHTDEAFAKAQGHPSRVLHGMCTASLYSTLAGMYLPGKYCLLLECDAKFVAPVYQGDLLTVSGTVAEIDERAGRIIVRADIRNRDGKKVSRAKIVTGFLSSPGETRREETEEV